MEKDWEQRYQAGDTPWDKGVAAPPLLELIERMGAGVWQGGPVLVPGCGAGHDVREIVRCGVEVVGMDIAPSAVELAVGHPAVGDERYELGDFLQFEDETKGRYSAIWEHTCFCAIRPSQRESYVRAAAHWLRAGGAMTGVFFLRPWDEGEEQEGPPFGVGLEELKEWFSPYFEYLDGWVPARAYPGREDREWIGLFRRLSKEVKL